jgi:uncharacterized protein (TIGR02231 family)
MKKLKTSLLFLFSVSVALAQNPIFTSAKLEKATIFLNQAQLDNSASTKIPAGQSKIIIENIANTVNSSSIQVQGKGDFMLMGVNFIPNHLIKNQNIYQDSIDIVSLEIENLNMLLSVTDNERKMLMANSNVKGDSKNLTSVELTEMTELFRKKLTDIGSRELKLKREQKLLEQKTSSLRKQMAEYQNSRLPLGQIEISVNAAKPTTAQLQISYIAHNAGWTPTYDIRVKDTQSPVEILQKANVFQNTGLNWENINLVLSTANPSVSATKPELSPYYLRFYSPQVFSKSKEVYRTAAAPANAMANQEMETVADVINVVSTALSVNYEIKIPYSIASGGKGEIVDIQKMTHPASFKTVITPKLNTNAFLTAELNDWEKLNLISGEANIYFENRFVGKSYINEQETDRELKLSLGRDARIVAERKSIENFKSRKILGSTTKVDVGYRIIIKNLKSETIKLVVEDQIPVSQDNRIEVEVLEISKAVLNPEDGKLLWELELGASQNKELLLKYQVKHPKDTQVPNL